MRYELTIVEQLDRAANELETDHPINNRLALILIDNATELIVHEHGMGLLENDTLASDFQMALQSVTKDMVGVNEPTSLFGQEVMSLKQRAAIRGTSLDPKLKVLEEIGDITGLERRFIKIAHGYRNELYHVGLKHDDIIRAIAGHYFLLCCDLFARLGQVGVWGRQFSSTDVYTDVAQRYFPIQEGILAVIELENEEIADKLRSALPRDIPELPATLVESAHGSIEEVETAFGFLVNENPFNFNPAEILVVVQKLFDHAQILEREDIHGLWSDPRYRENFDRTADKLEENWKQRHTSLPFRKWNRRAVAVGQETDPLIGMDMYQSLRNDMVYLEEAILSAERMLDEWVQEQIDIARGK